MDEVYDQFLRVLSTAIRGEKMKPDDSIRANYPKLYRMASEHHVLPMMADCLYDETQKGVAMYARELAVSQAKRTADFLLLMQELEKQGLYPVVIKGIVCRSMYPAPELRHSEDEDLFIRPEEYEEYKRALEAYGLHPANDEVSYEVMFSDEALGLFLELHTSLFPEDSDAYGDCNRFFEGAIDRAIELHVEDVTLRTLPPTDHLLFLICHAYKHFLHGGVGIRQLCDMGLMSEKYDSQIDWAYIRSSCEDLHIEVFTAGLFRICAKHLGFSMPQAFADIELDEHDLLEDILSGGLYGVNDIDRAHSSTMTIEAVTANKTGRHRKGALHSLFLPLDAMRGHFPYLKKHPWLLPVAWGQRIARYLLRKSCSEPVSPARSLQIARGRIELLSEYKIIRS